ncbi:internal core protein [Vibrio phage vB_VhaP_VH-5]|uniref:Internal core protein n=1 Tax=Vibrio phage vB_VhaP_VH-5 TaxID=2660694 RepID=A0A5Q2WBH4_9CAUD|nr:internal core protein [Vibrio phage vB_VhaP_VH-5]
MEVSNKEVKSTLGLYGDTRVQQDEEANYDAGSSVPFKNYSEVTAADDVQVGYERTGAKGFTPKSTLELQTEQHTEPVKATMLESFGAGFGGAGIQYARDIRSAFIYDLDPNFKHQALSNEFFEQNGAGTPEEVKYLAESKTLEDWQERKSYVLDKRMRQQAMSDNPVSGIAGSLVDADIAASAVPIIGWGGKAGSVARTANRIGAGATAGAATAGTQAALGDSLLRTEGEQMTDVAIMSVARALAPLAKGEALTSSVQASKGASGSTTPVVVPPAPTRSLADVQAAKDAELTVAQQVQLTNAEIDALPKKGRGAARRALLAQKRADAVQAVEKKYEAELAQATQANIQTLATQVAQDLQTLSTLPQGTPAQKVARNKHIAAIQSTWDELNYLTGGDTETVVNKLLSNPAVNNGDDVVSAQNVYLNNYNSRLMVYEDGLKDAIAQTGVRSNPITRVTGQYQAAKKSVETDFQEALQRVDADVLDYYAKFGRTPDAQGYEQLIQLYGGQPHIQELLRKYINSGLAEQVHKDLTGKGVITKEVIDATGEVKTVDAMEDIVRRPTYSPVRHDYNAMENLVNSGRATWDDLADFIGNQIVKQYPDLLKPKNAAKTFVLTTRQVGQHFLQTQKKSAQSLADVTATGMTKEEITTLLTRTGNMTDKDARIVAADIYSSMHKQGTSTPKNLRRRIGWDWGTRMRTSQGSTISMRDIVSNDVLGSLEDYTRSSGHRLGLADYGIKSETDLSNLLESYLSKLPKDVDPQQARQFFANTKDTLLGKPIENNPVPAGVRSAQAVADLFLLANSGLYTLVDIATQMQKVGVLRSLPYFKRGLGGMFKDLKGFSPTEAKNLEEVLTGRILAGSRHRNFTVRYADNFEVGGGVHEAAQYYGQTARFMNLSESLKRFQVGVLAGMYTNNLKQAMKGSSKELSFMREKLMMNDELIEAVRGEYKLHGADIDSWSNGVRVKYEQKLFHDADNFAMNIHNGEVPAILEYSQVGRIIFPYMRFALGMQNKVLRRTLQRDGHAGLAKLLAVQIPTAMLIAGAVNVRLGKEPTEDLAVVTIRSMTALGALNYPMEIAMAGLDGGGVTAMVPFSKSYKFGEEVLSGISTGEVDPNQLVKNSPLYANVVLDYLMLATEED